MEWPFEKTDVAEDVLQALRVGIAARCISSERQKHDRKIRPGRLLLKPALQRSQIGVGDRLFGDYCQACAQFELVA
jgi:hypothetical protein